jgi:hypothetical protein
VINSADLLARQPNMDIRLHIVAPDERKERVFREMRRPGGVDAINGKTLGAYQ